MARSYRSAAEECRYKVVKHYVPCKRGQRKYKIELDTYDNYIKAFDYCDNHGWGGWENGQRWFYMIYEIYPDGFICKAWDED